MSQFTPAELTDTVNNIGVIPSAVFTTVLLFLSSLVSASESALLSLSQSDILRLKQKNPRKTAVIERLLKKPGKLLLSLVILNSILNVATAIVAAILCILLAGSEIFTWYWITAAVASVTFAILLLGDILPRSIAQKSAPAISLAVVLPVNIMVRFLSPLTTLIPLSSSYIDKRLSHGKRKLSVDEITRALNIESGDLKEGGKIIKGLVNFGTTSASEIMCPRVDVTTIDAKAEFREILPMIIDSGFSRIPVYSGSFDNVLGILYVKDILPFSNKPGPARWQNLLRPAYFVPETKKISELLKEFQQKKLHMAIVVDEFGGTSGIITLEDILEEIVGEITDESDEDEKLYRRISENAWIFEGKVLLNDFYKILEIEGDPFADIRGESETLAGLILEITGEIPQKERVIEYGPFKFGIVSADKRRIKEIRVETTTKKKGEDES